jgi:hypothetical protein
VPIAEGIAAIKTGFDIAKSISGLVKEGNIDGKEVASQLILLQTYMLDSQRALTDAQEEIQKLKTAQADQQRTADIEDDFEWIADGSFWVRKSEKGTRDIRYCPQCWGDSRKLLPLRMLNPRGCYICDIHKTVYETEAYKRYRAQESQVLSSSGGPDSWMS